MTDEIAVMVVTVATVVMDVTVVTDVTDETAVTIMTNEMVVTDETVVTVETVVMLHFIMTQVFPFYLVNYLRVTAKCSVFTWVVRDYIRSYRYYIAIAIIELIF